MSDLKIWLVNNDMVVKLSNTKDIDGNFIDNATVTATLKDSSGVDVTGIVWPVTIPFVSSGLYRKIIDKAASVVNGVGYSLEINLVTPGGTDANWTIAVGGKTRTN